MRGLRPTVLAFTLVLLTTGCPDGGTSTGDGPLPQDTMPREDTPALCQDGKDNDGDGHIDCKDQNCWGLDVCKKKDGGKPDSSDSGRPDGLKDGPLVEGSPDLSALEGSPDLPVPDLPTDTAVTDGPVDLPADAGPLTPLAGCPKGCPDGHACFKGACHKAGPTKACGSNKYGGGLPSSGVIYVDGSYAGVGKGTQGQPYKTVTQALADVSKTKYTIAVAAGSYPEHLTFEIKVALHCRCPSMVTISGPVNILPSSLNQSVTIDGCRISPAGFPAKPKEWGRCNESTKSALYSVWGSSATNVYAVGAAGTVLRFDGNVWKKVAAGTSKTLRGVWGSSATDVWAVGEAGTVLRFDGKVWGTNSPGTLLSFNGVWGSSSSDVFIAADKGTIYRWNGKGFAAYNLFAYNAFYGVWGSASSNVWAVGAGATIAHFDGTTWSKAGTPASGSFFDVWGSSSSSFLVVGADHKSQGTVLSYQSATWKPAVSGSAHPLRGIWGSSSSDVYVTGDSGTALHYDGKVWKPLISGTKSNLMAVWGSSALDVYAVGDSGTILHYDGKHWWPMTGDDPRGINVTGGGSQVDLLLSHSEVAGWCHGVYFTALSKSNSSLCVSQSRVSANGWGLDIQNAPTTTTAAPGPCKPLTTAVTVVRSRLDQNRDFGFLARQGAQGISLQANVVERNGRVDSKVGGAGYGILLGNIDRASLKANRIDTNENRGIGLINMASSAAGEVEILDNTVRANRGAGISLQQLQAKKTVKVTGNWVLQTGVVGSQPGGDGIQVCTDKNKKYSYSASILGNTIDSSKRHGVFLEGVGGSVASNTVKNSGGYGVVLQANKGATVGKNTYSNNASGNTNLSARINAS